MLTVFENAVTTEEIQHLQQQFADLKARVEFDDTYLITNPDEIRELYHSESESLTQQERVEINPYPVADVVRNIVNRILPNPLKDSLPRKPGAPEGRLEHLGEGLDELSWSRLVAASHRAVTRLAMDNPDIDVVVKGKGDLLKWLKLTGAEGALRPGPNLRVMVGGDPQDLIMGATVICGFTTTALLEAMAAGKRVIVPRFFEAVEERTAPYFLDLAGAVDHADSEDDLYARLLHGVRNPQPVTAELPPERARLLTHWAGNPDGKSGARVAAAVLAELEARR